MSWKRAALSAGVVALVAAGVGCGGAMEENEQAAETPDGVEKNNNLAGKGDEWNSLNDPSRFRTDLNKNWDELKDEVPEGYTDQEVWPDTYWPTYKDNINQRWQGDDTLSPVEKYDRVYNDWTPEGGMSEFMTLQPFDTQTCEWDDAYYERLGPAAEEVARDGNWRAHNGEDDDGDGVPDSEECGYGEDKDYDGVETWWGLCHAWAPAAILHEEPKEPVTVEGPEGEEVTFEVADIKALLVDQYDRSESYMVGGRCNKKEIDRNEETGRIPDGQCQDVNPGSFHVLMTNFLGLQGRPIVEDRTYNYEVWNQPLLGYEITEQKEISEERVKELVGPDEDRDENNQPQTDEERTQVLRAANDLSKTELAETVGLRSEKAETIVGYREANGEFGSVDSLESEVGTRSISRLLNYAYDQGWLEEEPVIYDYDESADRYVEVKMKTDYLTESEASSEPLFDDVEEFTRHDRYHYIIELEEDGEITGGEWVGRSMENHPDFLWLPTGPGGGNRHIDFETVTELLEKSTPSDDSNGSDDSDDSDDSNSSGDSDQTRFENTSSTSIPDNDPDGATSTIEVDRSGTVSTVSIDLNIEHTYRGDLLVRLQKGSTDVLVYDGREAEDMWADDVELSGERVDGFGGLDVKGEWKLKVVDRFADDTGSVQNWALDFSLQ